jgi:sulfate/thiosulfate transport system substrate-binding protein
VNDIMLDPFSQLVPVCYLSFQRVVILYASIEIQFPGNQDCKHEVFRICFCNHDAPAGITVALNKNVINLMILAARRSLQAEKDFILMIQAMQLLVVLLAVIAGLRTGWITDYAGNSGFLGRHDSPFLPGNVNSFTVGPIRQAKMIAADHPHQSYIMAGMRSLTSCLMVLLIVLVFINVSLLGQGAILLNVSYDPTRELYQEFNSVFIQYWKQKTGQTVSIRQSHGGSGKQARAVVAGLEADVVTLALAYDINEISRLSGLLPANWQSRLPYNSSPYFSTVVFLVRTGNPRGIRDWDDLAKPGISVITPNPKTSGGARWNYLAAWAYGRKKFNGDAEKTRDFVKKIFSNVPVLDSGARGSTTTFVERKLGDVLVAWENEALLAAKDLGAGKFEIIYPSLSILTEPPVTVIDKVVDKHKTRALANAYLEFLYSEKGQEIIARHYYRPRDPKVAGKYAQIFPKINLCTIDNEFGGWEQAQKEHFRDGGTFDQLYHAAR